MSNVKVKMQYFYMMVCVKMVVQVFVGIFIKLPKIRGVESISEKNW